MNEELFKSKTVLHSRIQHKRELKQYYEFTESELKVLMLDIVKECAEIANENHKNYVRFGENLALLTLPNTADLINDYFETRN